MWELTPSSFVMIAGGTLVGPAVVLSSGVRFYLELLSLAKEKDVLGLTSFLFSETDQGCAGQ